MSDLTDQQIAEKLATWMGWTKTFDGWIGQSEGWVPQKWNPCESLDAAFHVQAEIARRYRICENKNLYIEALQKITASNADIDDPNAQNWNLINATARQRCLAAIAVIEEIQNRP